MNKSLEFLSIPLLLILSLFIASCGGEEEVDVASDESKTTDEVPGVNNEVDVPPKEDSSELPPPFKEKKVIHNPNGLYLPTGEEKNGKAVYENQEGFSMWNDGQNWKITDKLGGGKIISLGQANINSKWKNGAKARFYPDEEYAKDATFRLAVAFQGSEDNKNAIRLFEQFVLDYPEDKLVAEVYLSLGSFD